MTDRVSELRQAEDSQGQGRESLFDALRHDAEIGAGLRHHEDRLLSPMRFAEGVLKLIAAVDAADTEELHAARMRLTPTGDAMRYSSQRSLWELAKKRREVAIATLALPARPNSRPTPADEMDDYSELLSDD